MYLQIQQFKKALHNSLQNCQCLTTLRNINVKNKEEDNLRPLMRDEIIVAFNNTKSITSAARYLGVSLPTLYKYASVLCPGELKNQRNLHGVGIQKSKRLDLKEILTGKRKEGIDRNWLREQTIKELLLSSECSICGFNEKRVNDLKSPLVLRNKNGIFNDYRLENLELICHNCFFLYVAARKEQGKRIKYQYEYDELDKENKTPQQTLDFRKVEKEIKNKKVEERHNIFMSDEDEEFQKFLERHK